MSYEIDKITTQDMVQIATSDPRSKDAARFIQYHQHNVDEAPKPAELNALRMTYTQFALLTGRLAAIPGGAANPLFVPITEILRDSMIQAGVKEDDLAVLSIIHGSVSDLPETRIPEKYDWHTVRGRFHGGSQFEQRHIHAHTSCGLSEGNSAITRDLQWQRVQELEEAGIRLPITVAEAQVGRHSEAPYYDGGDFRAPLPRVSSNRDINFAIFGGGDVCPEVFNRMRQGALEAGKIEIGCTCLDLRAGCTIHHQAVRPIDHESLRESLRQQDIWARTFNEVGPNPSLESVGHTEFPIAVLVHEKADRDTLALAHWLLTHDEALLIHDQQAPTRLGRLAHSRPAIIGVPSALFTRPELVATLAGQVNRLVSNLNSELYDNGRMFGAVKLGKSTRGFVEDDGVILEVEHEDRGLEVIYPADTPEAVVQGLRTAHPVFGQFLGADRWSGLHPNPQIRASYPWSRRNLGRRITDYKR